MAVHQMNKQQQRKLESLKHSLYGFKADQSVSLSADQSALRSAQPESSDITYLRQDLLKIMILSGLALGSQMALYFYIKS